MTYIHNYVFCCCHIRTVFLLWLQVAFFFLLLSSYVTLEVRLLISAALLYRICLTVLQNIVFLF